MNYYLNQLSIKTQQLEIAKKGFVQVAYEYQTAKAVVCTDDEKRARIEYASVKGLAEQLGAGLGLIKELEKDIDYLHGKFNEEQEKENGNARAGKKKEI